MTDNLEPPIDGEVVGTDLEPVIAPPSGTLFRTDDPVEVVEQATRVADALKPVLTRQHMIQRISGKDHVKVEGWTTLGAMLGVVPVVVWTRKLDRGWEARVEARTLDGRVVGAAEAECLKDEVRWATADDYAVRSMAQTRATSKALSGPLRFVVTLAGYSGTPAEEMPAEGFNQSASASTDPPSEAQLKFLHQILDGKARGLPRPSKEQVEILARRVGFTGEIVAGWASSLTKGQCSALISKLKEEPLPDSERSSDVSSDASGFVHPQAEEEGDTPWAA